ncbi:uncharacterized protein F4822DRAFT_424742 [Hypoxylon trugodes]|uniref:uncharacterized protein n=1 Tax=Hypoxylon trugodes TaxID=326681 RepID=UPI00219DBDB4|nr:uncharacterized protein F4822DRAFT_424742 [Hypoxylon trugodes]KAI1394264.1 hypothetical protein F4822DRAFT_424742 [Hypoxylon trugodes]
MDQSTTEEPAKCDNPRCNEDSLNEIKTCAGCMKFCYCSRKCQKQHWKKHKPYCQHVTTNGTSSALLGALEYHTKIAVYDPEAKSLASDLDITLPAFLGGDIHILIRMTIIGKDTPEHFAILFGQKDADEYDNKSDNQRILTLLDAPPGSFSYESRRRLLRGSNLPYTPREPSAYEAFIVRKVREMQETIRQHMGSRGLADIGVGDMHDILQQFDPAGQIPHRYLFLGSSKGFLNSGTKGGGAVL